LAGKARVNRATPNSTPDQDPGAGRINASVLDDDRKDSSRHHWFDATHELTGHTESLEMLFRLWKIVANSLTTSHDLMRT